MKRPNNPGMSDAAWRKFIKLLARLNVKYASRMAEKEAKGSDGAA